MKSSTVSKPFAVNRQAPKTPNPATTPDTRKTHKGSPTPSSAPDTAC